MNQLGKQHAENTLPDLDSVIRQLDDRIAALKEAGDRRVVSLAVDRVFKDQLRENLRLGRFLDIDWTTSVVYRMSQKRLSILREYERSPRTCPDVWRI